MDSSSSFSPVSISNEKNLSIPFLVDWILTVVLCILVPFYFGRISAWILTQAVNVLLWRRHKVKITIQSIKISFLGGRIFFKNLTIVTRDSTVSFLEGSFTWRYWLLHTRVRGYDSESRTGLDAINNEKLPARFLLQCSGVEIFVYNHFDAYESLLKEHFATAGDDYAYSDSNDDDKATELTEQDGSNSKTSNTSGSAASCVNDTKTGSKLPILAGVFPIQLAANRGALVLGNRNTKHVGVFSFEQAKGIFDIHTSASKLDYYRKKLSLDLTDTSFQLRTNLGYQNDNPIKTFVVEKTMDKVLQSVSSHWNKFLGIIWRGHQLQSNDQLEYLESWKGLDIYQKHKKDENDDIDVIEFQDQEYARYSKIMKADKISLNYYYDIPGVEQQENSFTASTKVDTTERQHTPGEEEEEGEEEEQNSYSLAPIPPEFGCDIVVSTAAIYYGPWSNAHMQDIIRLFSPIITRDTIPKTPSTDGKLRQYETFKVSINFSDNSILHIPTREPSKDEDFLKRFKETGDTHRAFGWLNISLKDGSELLFNIALCSKNNYIPNELFINLLEPEVKSSVNHEILFKAKSQSITADVGYPTKWNGEAEWMFQLKSFGAELFLLKDHINLISDLFQDFSSRATHEYDLFRPFVYNIDWSFTDFKLILNVNDANIINNPLDYNENCFLSLSGQSLRTTVNLPFKSIDSPYHQSTFSISSPIVILSILPPSWNTLNEFLDEKTFGECPNFTLTGSYLSHSSVDLDNVDLIEMDIRSSSTKFLSFGFVVRYLMNIKLNYFGEFNHFKTTEEYSNDLRAKEESISSSRDTYSTTDDFSSIVSSVESESSGLSDEIAIDESAFLRKKNETDVWITFFVEDGTIVVPQKIYNSKSSYLLSFNSLEFDMRYTNYYMDLSLALSRINICRDDNFSFGKDIRLPQEKPSDYGIIDGLHIHGHRMFGVPPNEETYLCKWDIGVGSIKTDTTLDFLVTLFESLKKLGFSYKDMENLLIYNSKSPEDITSLSISLVGIALCVRSAVPDESINIALKDISINSWDLVNESYSKRLDAKIKSLFIDAVNKDGEKAFSLETSVDLSCFPIKKNFKNHKFEQRKCVLVNDSPFHRCKFLLNLDDLKESSLYNDLFGSITPSICMPSLAEPLTEQTFDKIFELLLGNLSNLVTFDADDQDTRYLMEDTSSIETNYGLSRIRSNRIKDYLVNTRSNSSTQNISIHLGPINISITPEVFSILAGIIKCMPKTDIFDTMDFYEMSVLELYSEALQNDSKVMNISLVSDQITVNIRPQSKIAESDEKNNSMLISISKLSILSQTKSTAKISAELDVVTKGNSSDSTLMCDVDDLKISINKTPSNTMISQDSIATFYLSTLNTVLCTDIDMRSRLQIGTVRLSFSDDDVDMITDFTILLVSSFSNSVQKIKSSLEMKKDDKIIMLLKIAQLGQSNGIDSVPYVITKPAYITRLSKYHVRDNSSWRAITRLRFVSRNIPETDYNKIFTDFNELEKTESSEVRSRFLEVFSHWKNWDVTEIEQSALFEFIFPIPIEDNDDSSYKDAKLSFEKIHLEVNSIRQASLLVIKQLDIILRKLTLDSILDFDSIDYDKKELDVGISTGSLYVAVNEDHVRKAVLLSRKLETKQKKSLNISKSFALRINQCSLGLKNLTIVVSTTEYKASIDLNDALIIALKTTFERNSVFSVKYSSGLIAFGFSYLNQNLLRIQISSIEESFIGMETDGIYLNRLNIGEVIIDSSETTLQHLIEHSKSLKLMLNNMKGDSKQISVPGQEDGDKKTKYILKSLVALEAFELKTSLFSPFDLKFKLTTVGIISELGRKRSISANYEELLLDIFMNSYKLVRIFNSTTRIDFKDDILLNDVDVDITTLKVTLCDNRFQFDNIIQSIQNLLAQREKRPSDIKCEGTDQNISKPWSFNLNCAYMGFLIEIDKTNYVIEINEISLSYLKKPSSNIKTNKVEPNSNVWFNTQSLCFLVVHPDIPSILSKVLDIGATFKLTEDSSKSALQVESHYTRLSLCSSTLFSILFLIREGKMLFHDIPSFFSDDNSPTTPKDSSFLQKLSINVLSYKLCLGWLFEGENRQPGIMLGYESLFMAYERPFGKLTFVDGYVSIAQGKQSNDFYITDGIPKFNRSHLSSMQLNFWFHEKNLKKDLFIRMNADSIDVSVMTDIVDVAASTVASIKEFQRKLSSINERYDSNNSNEDHRGEKFSSKVLIPSINSINCVVNYGGGTIKLFNPTDVTELDQKSSFELTSPSSEVSVSYLFDVNKEKNHWIRSYVNVESTHNILYSSCVPVLVNLQEEMEQLLGGFNTNNTSTAPNDEVATKAEFQKSHFDYNNLLKNFDVAFIIHIGKQDITLSCEPKAKIQADLGFSNFKISLFTNPSINDNSVSVSLQWSKIEINTRHVFSREISSSAGIDDVLLDVILTEKENISIYGHIMFSGTKLYMNLKQLQDISLFLDIWSPKIKKNESSRVKGLQAPKTKSKPVSESSATKIPWVYRIIFKNTSASIDMDPSLGSINFQAPSFWISSRHSIDWSHSVSFFLKDMKSNSEGRLGGSLEIGNLLFDSSVNWPIRNHKFEAPLVKVSVTVGYLSIKLGFDYHSFLIAVAHDIRFALWNERDESGLLKDLLAVSATCGSINVFLTALSSANLYDIHNTFERLRMENKKSYVQTLKESNPESSGRIRAKNSSLVEPLRLRTNLVAEIGSFRLQVFPSTLFDSEVLVLKATKMNVEATTQTEQKTKTDLTWQIHDININLARFNNDLTDDNFSTISVEEYNSIASAVDGDIILAAPSVFVGITTWQKIPDTRIELLYSSSFGDKVDIKWNLDPINFIREMWATHVRALSARRGHAEASPSKPFFEDENIAEKIKIVDLGTKYQYVPLDEPHIEMPLLKDLGNATPPIEWFGVNRKRFPGMTHQLVVVPLQKLIYVAEGRYNNILGDNLNSV